MAGWFCLAANWLAMRTPCRGGGRYFVKMSLSLLVTLKRYSLPPCSMMISRAVPSNSELFIRAGKPVLSPCRKGGVSAGVSGEAMALFMVTNDNDYHYSSQPSPAFGVAPCPA